MDEIIKFLQRKKHLTICFMNSDLSKFLLIFLFWKILDDGMFNSSFCKTGVLYVNVLDVYSD